MSGPQSADLPLLISRSAANDAVRDALRIYVGRGRRYSVKVLSNGTGVKDRTIECAMYASDHPEHRALRFEALLSIARFLGATFTTEIIRLCDQGAFDLPDDEPNPGDIATDASQAAANVVRAFQTGEHESLPTIGSMMMTRGAQLVAIGKVA